MSLDLGSSKSKTSSTVTTQTVSDQGTAITNVGKGTHLVGSTLIKIGKGGSLNIQDPAGAAALQHVTDELGRVVSAQASLGMSGERNPTTGLTTPTDPATDYTKPSLIGLAILGGGLLLILFLKRR